MKIILDDSLIKKDTNVDTILNEQIASNFELALNSESCQYFSQYEYKNNLVKGQTKNHFLNAFLTAYNNHLTLKLRPDDIHLALQLIISTCITNNAEKLRNIFVDHQGQKELAVELPHLNIDVLLHMFGDGIKNNIKCKDFADNVITNYTTTTQIISNVSKSLLMNAMKEYFTYTFILGCGIPSVILEGTIEDWNKLKTKYEYFKNLLVDTELKNWFKHFDVIMSMFIEMRNLQDTENSYEATAPIHIKKLWERVISYVPQGSGGSQILGGWIRLFFPYSTDKKIIDNLNVETIECLNIKNEPIINKSMHKYASYDDQDALIKFYVASGWDNVVSSCLATPLKIINTYTDKTYSAEIYSGFFEHSYDSDIVSVNVGLIIQKDSVLHTNQQREKYLSLGVKENSRILNIPCYLSNESTNICKIFHCTGSKYYLTAKCLEKIKYYEDNGVHVGNIISHREDNSAQITKYYEHRKVYFNEIKPIDTNMFRSNMTDKIDQIEYIKKIESTEFTELIKTINSSKNKYRVIPALYIPKRFTNDYKYITILFDEKNETKKNYISIEY